MNVRKFYASTTREALRQVRDVLGADAIILSNRQVAGGVEIMAVSDMDVSSLTAAAPPPAAPSLPVAAPQPTAVSPPPVEPPPPPRAEAAPTPVPPPKAPEPPRTPAPVEATAIPVEPPKPARAEQQDVVPDEVMRDIAREIKFLRGMLEGQLAGLAWGDLQRRDPDKVEILRGLLTVGLSPVLARQLLDRLPHDTDYVRGLRWVRAALMKNLQVVGGANDIVDRGGVYALVGPTGVGKTTTVAKIAARCTLKHGPAKVALLTTDSYRIGAHEQLRIYGKILGVPVHAIKDESDLKFTLADLQNKHLVLIDTVGMSQRDRRVAEQVALLAGIGRGVRRLLLLSATAQGTTLEDVVRSYTASGNGHGRSEGGKLDGCILTKVDEAVSLGNVVDVVIRHRLRVHYVTNGQRVPEDLHSANPAYLMDRVFKAPSETGPFVLKDQEFPLMMAGDGAPQGADPEGGYRG